jgi:pimeloyl-ACP methyl ester carboxylesterase
MLVVLLLAACSGTGNLRETRHHEPETVVMLHGFGRSQAGMRLLGDRIEQAGYRVVQVNYESFDSSPDESLAAIRSQIDACCKELRRPVHFVGFSLGGLMVRAYLADHELASLGRVVLIATPNRGTPLVDSLTDTWWLDIAGPTARSLGTNATSFPNSLPEPDYPVGIIAGLSENGIASFRIPGDDDGVVPLESTKLQGMTDFIILEMSHFFLRYSAEVAEQTIAFLQQGRFIRDGKRQKVLAGRAFPVSRDVPCRPEAETASFCEGP